MELQTVVEKLQQVPPAFLDEVNDFIQFIIEKKAPSGTQMNTACDGKVPEWKRGALKGIVTYMAPDFDEPMEEFKDYM